MIRSERQSTPSEGQLDEEGGEEREEWSVPCQQDSVRDPSRNRSVRHDRLDRRNGKRQRSADSVRDGRRGEWNGAGIPIAAAGHRRRRRGIRIVAPVIRSRLPRHVGCTVDLTAFGEAQRQRQRRSAQQHCDNHQRYRRPKACRDGHELPPHIARSVPDLAGAENTHHANDTGVPARRRRFRCRILHSALWHFPHRAPAGWPAT